MDALSQALSPDRAWVFWTVYFYALFFKGNRWFPVLSPWILWCSLLMLCANAKSIASAFTFWLPRHKNLRNPLFCFSSPKDPSTWILRFIRSFIPSSLSIRSRSASRYSSNFFDTYRFLFRSSKGVLQWFPLMHSFLYGHPPHSWQV